MMDDGVGVDFSTSARFDPAHITIAVFDAATRGPIGALAQGAAVDHETAISARPPERQVGRVASGLADCCKKLRFSRHGEFPRISVACAQVFWTPAFIPWPVTR